MYCSLADIIGDICMGFNPGQVYGFFAGEPVMSGSGAKYRYFYTEGIKKALQKGFKPARLGCFWPGNHSHTGGSRSRVFPLPG